MTEPSITGGGRDGGEGAARGDFLSRALRVLAIICLAAASLDLIAVALHLASGHVGLFHWVPIEMPAQRWLNSAITFCYFSTLAALLAGGAGLLKWRRWARTVLLAWAVAALALSFATMLMWLLNYLANVRAAAVSATTQPAPQSLASMAATLLSSWFTGAVLPAIVAWVMLQPEVKQLWARVRAGGFDVVPMARMIERRPGS